jgi:hypothetical protein
MTEAHNSWIGGHGGRFKTTERLRGEFWWPGMDADIGSHVATCIMHHVPGRDEQEQDEPATISAAARTTRSKQTGTLRSMGPSEVIKKEDLVLDGHY